MGTGRKLVLLLRFLDSPTTKPGDGSTAQFIIPLLKKNILIQVGNQYLIAECNP